MVTIGGSSGGASIVMLSVAKHLAAHPDSPFAALRGPSRAAARVISRENRKRHQKRHQQMKHYYVYIMTNRSQTLSTGLTHPSLQRRRYEHKHPLGAGFTSQDPIPRFVSFD